jgi:hypothetical protein
MKTSFTKQALNNKPFYRVGIFIFLLLPLLVNAMPKTLHRIGLSTAHPLATKGG